MVAPAGLAATVSGGAGAEARSQRTGSPLLLKSKVRELTRFGKVALRVLSRGVPRPWPNSR
jgi:hypothetical protein